MRPLAAFHRAFAGEPDNGWCGIGDRYAMFAPGRLTNDDGPGRHPVAARIVAGWELFAEHVAPEIVDLIFSVHADQTRIEQTLAGGPMTLLHGDAKPENLGLAGDRLVAIDWGELTGVGAAAIDVGWFAVKAVTRSTCSADDIVGAYERAAGEPLAPDTVDAVFIGSLAQMGFRFALGAHGEGLDPPDVAADQLAWWTRRVDAAASRLGWW